MLRYDRQTKPGLVALYDIRLGNRAGLFLQPEPAQGPFHVEGWKVSPPCSSTAIVKRLRTENF